MRKVLTIVLAALLALSVAGPAAARGKPAPPPQTPSITISPTPVYTSFIPDDVRLYDLVFSGVQATDVVRWTQGPQLDSAGNVTGYCTTGFGTTSVQTVTFRTYFVCTGSGWAAIVKPDGTYRATLTWTVLPRP